MKNQKTLMLTVLIWSLSLSWLCAAEPVITGWDGVREFNIRAMDSEQMSVSASDPDGDALSYQWVIEQDPTGAAFWVDGGSTRLVTLGVQTTSVSIGSVIKIRVDVSDGSSTVSRYGDVTVTGINQAPVLDFDVSNFGTPQNPRAAGQGITIDASKSYDPDYPELGSKGVGFWWRNVSFPSTCGTVPILFGYYSANPTLVVPELPHTEARSTVWEVAVQDGLHLFVQRFTGYVVDNNGCAPPPPPGGSAPVVSLTANPGHAAWGQTVNLTASVTNPDAGETYSYSWKQLGVTSAATNVNLPNVNSPNNSFVAPGVSGTLYFEVSVTDPQGTGKGLANVLVSENGGETPGQTGTATGTEVPGSCETVDGYKNKPGLGTLPAKVTAGKGQVISITATNLQDPDLTPGSLGFPGTAVNWTVQDGKGLLSDSALSGASTSTVSFVTPNVTTTTTFVIRARVDDAVGCGTYYDIAVEVSASTGGGGGNTSPTAVLKYQLPGGNAVIATGQTVQVPVPVEIALNASESSDPDGDALTYAWQPQLGDFQGGGYTLTSGTTSRTLKIFDGSTGSITIQLTITDGKGGQATQSVKFQVDETLAAPVAVVDVLMEGAPLGDRVAENGSTIVLDPGETYVPGGTGEEELSYYWEQLSGPTAFAKGLYVPVESTDPGSAIASIRVDGVEEETSLEFRLTVQNGVLEDSVTVTIPVRPGSAEEGANDLYFAQVGFGPLGDLQFRTVLVVDNVSSENTDDLSAEFFDQQGQPIQLRYTNREGSQVVWANDEQIPANSSRVFELLEPEGDDALTVGWAHISSESRLRGSVRYQVVDKDSGEFVSDVGIFSSPRGRKFQIAFREKDHLAFAVANPADDDAVIKISVLDPDKNVVDKHSEIVDPHNHLAVFLEDILDTGDVQEGTLIVEALEGEIIPAVLITRNSVAISSQTFSKIQ